jgi:hypothetical protein
MKAKSTNVKMFVQLNSAPLPPPPPPHQHLQQAPRVMTMPPAAVRPPLAPAMPKGRRNFQSPSPTSSPVPPSDSFRKVIYQKGVRFSLLAEPAVKYQLLSMNTNINLIDLIV